MGKIELREWHFRKRREVKEVPVHHGRTDAARENMKPHVGIGKGKKAATDDGDAGRLPWQH
ncbi:hypothetical protein DQG23_05240 [Paenibacillus contaminans]|uniref:Uncharacterized protein n=1 Tax=Paenibacillus contaminans TaxID=450362 RepID=A0A329MQU4_9BACL|nr:hypothetical protein DQG23_05240 [Paenibacillus contaminans]